MEEDIANDAYIPDYSGRDDLGSGEEVKIPQGYGQVGPTHGPMKENKREKRHRV